MRSIYSWSLAAAVVVAGCARKEEPRADTQAPAQSRAATEARIRELEQQARALVKTDGCDQVGQCAAAPVGAKGCGGPRSYLVYCKATTDEAALLRTLDELKRVEGDYNREYQIASDCMMIMPPELGIDGRACTAATP
jgi:hypothetical protein